MRINRHVTGYCISNLDIMNANGIQQIPHYTDKTLIRINCDCVKLKVG